MCRLTILRLRGGGRGKRGSGTKDREKLSVRFINYREWWSRGGCEGIVGIVEV